MEYSTESAKIAVQSRELYKNWNIYKRSKVKLKDTKVPSSIMGGRLFSYLFSLIMNDIIDNGIVFEFPSSETFFEMGYDEGERLKKLIAKGVTYTQNVDYLATNFRAYHLRMRQKQKRGLYRNSPIIPLVEKRDKIIELTNNGKKY